MNSQFTLNILSEPRFLFGNSQLKLEMDQFQHSVYGNTDKMVQLTEVFCLPYFDVSQN